MDTAAIYIAVIGLIQAAVTAIIGGLFAREARDRKRQIDKANAQAELRAEESRLSMRLISADMKLTMATAHAVKEGKTNGKMDAALRSAEEAEQEYHDFVNSIAAKHITK